MPTGQTAAGGGLHKTNSGLPDDGEILAELDEAETKLISVLVYMHGFYSHSRSTD